MSSWLNYRRSNEKGPKSVGQRLPWNNECSSYQCGNDPQLAAHLFCARLSHWIMASLGICYTSRFVHMLRKTAMQHEVPCQHVKHCQDMTGMQIGFHTCQLQLATTQKSKKRVACKFFYPPSPCWGTITTVHIQSRVPHCKSKEWLRQGIQASNHLQTSTGDAASSSLQCS